MEKMGQKIFWGRGKKKQPVNLFTFLIVNMEDDWNPAASSPVPSIGL